jgi:hypothetical protein
MGTMTADDMAAAMDRSAVRELLDRYSHAVDFLDWTLLETVFAPDATVDYRDLADVFGQVPTVATGLPAIRDLYEAVMRPHLGTLHYMTNHLIDLDDDVATTRTYMHVGSPGFGGLYCCRCVRTDRGWRIRDYRFVLHTRDHPATPDW